MELRELLMAETTAVGVGVDPARITQFWAACP
jgi:hypothetical protein